MKQTELDLEHLAKLGAQEEIRLLQTQIAALKRFAGELVEPNRSLAPAREVHERAVFTAVAEDRPQRGRHAWSDAQRQAVSRRMRTYWRQRRAAEK